MRTDYQDNHVTLYQGNFLENDLPDECVQCCVTSPPYWGLRKYDAPDITWNGWKGQLGLEPTPEMYIEHIVQIFREVKRVLRKDGVCFLNLGDSYWGGKGQSGQGSPEYQAARQDVSLNKPHDHIGGPKQTRPSDGRHSLLKPKDLCGIPWRVALALQADGWWLRCDIIWSKPNPMPESVKDRPTNSHEYIFMLTKSARYYWDQEAVREPLQETTVVRYKTGWNGNQDRDYISGPQNHFSKYLGSEKALSATGRNIRSVWEFPTQPYPEAHFAVFPEKLPETCIKAATKEGDTVLDPFCGSGTTLWVAKRLNRKAIGFDLSEKYCELAVKRNRQQVIL